MRVSFELQGLKGLQDALKRSSSAVKARAADAMEDTAHAVQAHARMFVPRDKGDLARAIQMDGRGLNWRVGVVDARISSRGGSNAAHLNPAVYGIWYEYGFTTRNIQSRPFMKPAAEAERGAHQNRMKGALDAALREA
jgi:hypothetical protein